MKQVLRILTGTFFILLIQAILNLNHPVAEDSHANSPVIGLSENDPGNTWIENPWDDNAGEIKGQLQARIPRRECYERLNQTSDKLAQENLLNPLLLDRPPPVTYTPAG